MKFAVVTSLFLSLLMSSSLFAADSPKMTEAEFVQRTQHFYDAVASGDRTLWNQYFADDAMIFDEKGRDMDKKALIADLEPLPKGYTGIIKVEHAKARFAENVAILSYDCNETETIFGTELHARYHSTDTWLYRNQLWQIISSQTLRYYEDPAATTINPSVLNDYVGKYELAPGNQMTVIIRDGQLYTQRGTNPPTKLLPESPDMFFRAGIEGRRYFHRDSSGKVDKMIDRRNNEDLVWKRID